MTTTGRAAICVPAQTPALDDLAMGLALDLAEQAIGLSDPNPRVGCVIMDRDGRLIGAGHTQQAGQAHAEVMALRDAAARGESVVGATAYVTLEPCAHHGRTPPCCEALIRAQLARVVVATGDPHPKVCGQGLRRLREAGIEVAELEPGALRDRAEALNVGFFHRIRTGRPWVRLKAAMSLDGCVSLLDGTSKWITGPQSRRDGQLWRKRSGAVLTGIGTVLADDPRLTVRDVVTVRQPLRVVLDSQLRLSPSAAILRAPGDVLVYTVCADDAKRLQLQAAGASVHGVDAGDGRLELADVLADLGRREINELHVEAGPTVNGAFVEQGLVNEYLLYLAPVLLGPGRGLASRAPISALNDGARLSVRSVETIGQDLRVLARPVSSPDCRL